MDRAAKKVAAPVGQISLKRLGFSEGSHIPFPFHQPALRFLALQHKQFATTVRPTGSRRLRRSRCLSHIHGVRGWHSNKTDSLTPILSAVTSIWVADLRISDPTAHKIETKHGLSPGEVRAAVLRVSGLNYSWDNHPTRGLRVIIDTRIRDFRVLIVLYPRENDVFADSWNLGSAYPISE